MISIIVSIYNAENYLSKCLNDLRYQTYHKLEIILVNNGSTDASGEICERFSRADPRFKVIHKSNFGISAAYNAGLLIANGKYVSFVNALDRVDGMMFESLLSLSLKTGADMVICSYIEETHHHSSKPLKPYRIQEWSSSQAIQQEINRETMQGFMNNKLFMMDLFKESITLRFNPSIYFFEDLLLCIECMLKSKKIIYTSTSYYHSFKNRYPLKTSLSLMEWKTGLTALLTVIVLCESLEESNVTILKERYTALNLELLMQAYDQASRDQGVINELKHNLYRYKLTELKNKKLRMACLTARNNVRFSYCIWKRSNKKSLISIK
ncbi:glycosyltransferase family 2 protein [Carnobacterium mobile]|uniref:glycosyltransferase family 2 protein n=1 Tax=Carnobacterium mobile TaxID=2750 RepID=UPI00054E90CF|nr:glycosyltransferase [Carnobacterium mobile]